LTGVSALKPTIGECTGIIRLGWIGCHWKLTTRILSRVLTTILTNRVLTLILAGVLTVRVRVSIRVITHSIKTSNLFIF
jgi:hypothetical protein